MPESPEVQALAEFLDDRLTGQTISSVDILEFRVIKTRAAPPGDLVGESISGVDRFGKHLDIRVGDRHLGVALGRHGWARWTSRGGVTAAEGETPPALASIGFDGGDLLEFTDAGSWVSLGLSVTDRPADVAAVAKLGADPADPAFVRAQLDAVVTGRRKQLKALLQEQESIAGIGNAYSDEILHRARLSPVIHASELDDEQRGALFDATVGTIREAIGARRGIPIDQLKAAKVASMRVHGRAGEPCPVCGDTVRDVRLGSSTASYCPACQTGGAILH
ncbi:DNA-formamidopyrimidine glycosylase family protein [Microbacterium sp. SLBN-146]|uniref:DNA-formamidopyrimidine glycosylase family protein n=1 Tax=Microbacterium sp. SLBN-146 TaxID=2768457 RepID=UPI00115209D7|nr:DNA-formamidopyrimidine glycosylase family protein [Microbacterium sp. SLBN-146]TQJ31715.1 formamidopyrimidine-DNA glycosylase [Microbacterium sp. SLBN-146]